MSQLFSALSRAREYVRKSIHQATWYETPLAWTIALILLVAGLVAARHSVPGPGLDFASSVWAPGRAILHGFDPYHLGVVERFYPRAVPFPLYGPPHLVLAIVVALLPLRVAGALWLVLTVLALAGYVAWAVKLAVGRVSISLSAAVMGILLVSRPGFNLVELGQPTVVYLPLCWIVWRADSNRWTSAVALAFLLGKPPFAIPVLVFLLIQRSWVLLGRGLAIGAVVSAPILALLVRSEHGVSGLVHAVSTNNSALARLDEGIAQRIDVTALVVRWTGSNDWWVYVVCAVMVLGLTGLAIRRRLAVDDYRVTAGSRNREAIVLAMALATLVSITHEDYDVLLLLVPIGAAWSACRKAVWPVVPAIAAVVLHTPARLPSVLTYERIAEFTAFLLLFALAVIDIQLARGGSVHKFEHALRRDDRSLNGPN